MPALIISTEKQENFLAQATALHPGDRISEVFKSKQHSCLFRDELERIMRKNDNYSVKVYREGRYVTAKKLFPEEIPENRRNVRRWHKSTPLK